MMKMKKIFGLVVVVLLASSSVNAQKIYGTRNGKISFTAQKDEDVTAVNNEVVSRLSDKGEISFSLLLKGFKFAYAEMQTHFNNDYLQSNQFPRADFKGNITNIKTVDFTKNGNYKVAVKGNLTLHGVTKPITVNGIISVKAGKLTANAQFIIVMKDFNIDAATVTNQVNAEINCVY
ncbi:MAG: YceI family protein [Sphingobacteriia bacterium]|nr:MAG: YceI family protein [Sphingobacteriia bacterium]TAG30651.1 MAG: YceI family protein [Sphingobacteriia bacterium]